MAAFEFGNYPERPGRPSLNPAAPSPQAPAPPVEGAAFGRSGHHHIPNPIPPQPKVITEPLMVMKIYDTHRHKHCLGHSEIGPAHNPHSDSHADHIIIPPPGAQSVEIEDLEISRIVIGKKKPSRFKKGYWDVDVRFIFSYGLRFVDHDGHVMGEPVPATNTFTRKCCLFGSDPTDVVMATDMFDTGGMGMAMGKNSYISVEAKAIGLSADITRKHCRHHDDPPHVNVVIGLFSIIKLYRMVSLLVESRGFVIPEPGKDVIPPNPCDFFDHLGFPMDSFAPPQKPEYMAGISGDIPGKPLASSEDVSE
jgi:hypothetical protein